jgi:ATP-binding protein involved in chromosome partitioning
MSRFDRSATVKYVTKRPMTLQNQLEKLLQNTPVPWLDQSLAEAGACSVSADAEPPHIIVQLGYPATASTERLLAPLRQQIAAETGREDVVVELEAALKTHAVQGTLSPVEGIKNILVVSSAKGGVGKSTVAANLALALQHEGARVGMLDADIYGPSQPIMLGVTEQQPVSKDGERFEPIEAQGLQLMSIGNMIDPGQPMIWRGPMVTRALNQLLFQTNWHDLDYLVIDMPPGTGDIQLTLGQKVPVSGAVIVTTPQDIALADAIRGLRMFEQVDIPVLGLIENMSSFMCPSCGDVTPLFGAGGGVNVAAENELSLLAQLPLDIRIREEADSGKPTVLAAPDSELGLMFRDMALATVAKLAQRPRDYKGAFGNVKVEPKMA